MRFHFGTALAMSPSMTATAWQCRRGRPGSNVETMLWVSSMRLIPRLAACRLSPSRCRTSPATSRMPRPSATRASIPVSRISLPRASTPTAQVAGGVTAFSQQTITTRGTVSSSTVATNMAINGDGFFSVQKPTSVVDNQPVFNGVTDYTRAGDFQVNANGNLVNGAGYYLMGVTVDPKTGNPLGNVPQVLQFQNNFVPAQATSTIQYAANLPTARDDGEHHRDRRHADRRRRSEPVRLQRRIRWSSARRRAFRRQHVTGRPPEPARQAAPVRSRGTRCPASRSAPRPERGPIAAGPAITAATLLSGTAPPTRCRELSPPATPSRSTARRSPSVASGAHRQQRRTSPTNVGDAAHGKIDQSTGTTNPSTDQRDHRRDHAE